MDILKNLPLALHLIFNLHIFILMVGGLAFGTILGAIPGLTGGIGIALMVPLTFYMEPLPALVFLCSIYTGGNWGGAITAILLNAPGSPASAATSFDGYPMMQKGRVGEALGLAVASSSYGTLIGAIILLLSINVLGNLALKFGSAEMLMVAVLGLTIIATLTGKSIIKGYLSGLFGLLLGTIGISPTGAPRAVFGMYEFFDGIPIIPALIGLFCFSELLFLMDKTHLLKVKIVSKEQRKGLLKSIIYVLKNPFQVLKAATVGVLIGALPGAGATVASLLSYDIAKKTSSHPDKFGTGCEEGIVASEAANNASEGGALATMLVLGIPGGSATAVMLGAIILQGWVPGPRLIYDHSEIIFAFIITLFFQAILLLPIGAIISFYFSKIVFISNKYLIPFLVIFAITGTYAPRRLLVDPIIMVLLGIIGWIMRRYDYPVIGVILGLILGPIVEENLVRITQRFAGNFSVILTRPISLVLLIITLGLLFIPKIINYYKGTRV